MFHYCKLLISVMKNILSLTLDNECFARRRDALASPNSRRNLLEKIGGAHRLKTWRRRETWNKGRLQAIADGSYRPNAPLPGWEPKSKPAPIQRPVKPSRAVVPIARNPAKLPAVFRLPPQRDLLRAHHRRARVKRRADPAPPLPCIVVFPHEIDGQYVPGFTSRAAFPAAQGYHAISGFEASARSVSPEPGPPP